jgi:hypothetical protein|nr:MAG TPA: hypothetical protein [Caudoviricetes sp.]
MERLTYFKDGYWRVNFSGVQYQADFVDRLAAYEDTGLYPESVEALKLSMMGKAISEITEFEGLPIDRLRELAEADKDGRVVVLPCKVGDTVWIVGTVRKLYSAKVRTFFCGHPSAVRGDDVDGHIHMIRTTECDIPMQEFGKTVFLSRAEAERAIQEMEGKG